MPLSEHDEIERKLAADGVLLAKFMEFVVHRAPTSIERFVHLSSPDYYYSAADGKVLRHRVNPGQKHELTIKLRKSDQSTFDRREIDLHFSDETSPADVDAFVSLLGYQREFKLVKDCHIFWIRASEKVTLTVVVYDAWREEAVEAWSAVEGTYKKRVERGRRRFIEVEAEKGSDVTVDTAKRHVSDWVKALRSELNLAEPLNESLYEIYSGKKYQKM